MFNRSFLVGLGVGGAGHKYWRVYLSGADASAGQQLCSDLEMRASASGPDQCTGGTPSASTTSGDNVAANCFDGSTSTLWAAASSGTTNEWIKYVFAADVDVKQISYMSNTIASGRGPTEIQLQYSDDDSAWVTVQTWSAITGWVASVAKIFDV